MAGTSPTRRSSRARTAQSQSHHSSATSSSSGRLERSTRAFTKTGSPEKSTGSGSLSSEPPEDSTATTASDDIHLPRRRSTRGKDDDKEKQPKANTYDMAGASDDNGIQEEDEAVRCVCGYDDYPGPPPLDEDTKSHPLKDSIDIVPIFSGEITDDMAGFFVQCDVCKVWEHGLCVGIVSEDSLPDEYYCELCRKDLHKVYTASNGNKFSVYLPIHRPSRRNSRATSAAKDSMRSPRINERKKQAATTPQTTATKRRSTMNSRDAAYDEEEQLRRAIEASKEEAGIAEEPDTTVSRRPKRGRDDDEEQPENSKRQRTVSKSPSPPTDRPLLTSREDSEDDSTGRNGSLKKSSRTAARTQREKAERDERREEQERKRAEAASKRQGRAERRRADGITATTIVVKVFDADVDVAVDSDPSEEVPQAARAAVEQTNEPAELPEPPASSQPAPDTPSTTQAPSNSQKKKAASHHKKGKGRNQYTRDRDTHENEESPARSMSRDTTRNQDENSTTSSTKHGHDNRHHTRSRGGMNSKITMNDLKRRVNNILEFITRTQVELASDPLSEKNSPPNGAASDQDAAERPSTQVNGDNKGKKTPSREEVKKDDVNPIIIEPSPSPGKGFRELSCVEMMDSLTRDLVKWQQEYAV